MYILKSTGQRFDFYQNPAITFLKLLLYSLILDDAWFSSHIVCSGSCSHWRCVYYRLDFLRSVKTRRHCFWWFGKIIFIVLILKFSIKYRNAIQFFVSKNVVTTGFFCGKAKLMWPELTSFGHFNSFITGDFRFIFKMR